MHVLSRRRVAKPPMLKRSLMGNTIKSVLLVASLAIFVQRAGGQIQLDLKFQRLQFIAYEPIVATLAITNLAGARH